MGIPSVNIGNRQKGRMMPKSVISCKPDYESIRRAIARALEEDFQGKAKSVISPYGDGHTSQLIVEHILEFLRNKSLNRQKKFYDLEFMLED